MSDLNQPNPDLSSKSARQTEPQRELPPAARRALAEAEARRAAYLENERGLPREIGGRKDGLEPGRYGDWEVKGLATDF